jgi:hypothetical protein
VILAATLTGPTAKLVHQHRSVRNRLDAIARRFENFSGCPHYQLGHAIAASDMQLVDDITSYSTSWPTRSITKFGNALNDLNVLAKGISGRRSDFDRALNFLAIGGVFARIKENLNTAQHCIAIYAPKLPGAM